MSEPAPPPTPDPLIDEVRAVRRAISEECGNDIDALCDRLLEVEKKCPSRIVKSVGQATSAHDAR